MIRAVALVALWLWTATAASAAVAPGELSCTPPGADIANPTAIQLTAEQKTVLIDSYRAPDIRGLRGQLNAYIDGSAKEATARTLAGMPHALVHEPFFLLADEAGIMGGSYLTFQFVKHPVTIYRAWVYQLPSGAYEVRGWESAPCSAAEQRYMRVTYGKVIELIPGG